MNRMQHVHDALKKMRADGEAWLTHEGTRMKIVPLKPEMTEWRPVQGPDKPEGIPAEATPCLVGYSSHPEGWWFPAYDAIVKTKARGGVKIASVWWHEGRLHTDGTPTGGVRRGDDDVVLAIIIEKHPRAV